MLPSCRRNCRNRRKQHKLSGQEFSYSQEVQRVSDEDLAVLPANQILFRFPKYVPSAKTTLILQGPKTEGSYRKQYLTTPLIAEIQERLAEIRSNKEFFGEEYQDCARTIYNWIIVHLYSLSSSAPSLSPISILYPYLSLHSHNRSISVLPFVSLSNRARAQPFSPLRQRCCPIFLLSSLLSGSCFTA